MQPFIDRLTTFRWLKCSERGWRQSWRRAFLTVHQAQILYWLTENDYSDQEKKEIVDSFRFEDFICQELLTDVRNSDLYSIDKIDKKVLELMNSRDQIISHQRRDLVKRDLIIRRMKDHLILNEGVGDCCDNCGQCEKCEIILGYTV